MKIEGVRPTGAHPSQKTQSAAAPGFAPAAQGGERVSAAASSAPAPSLNALLALQGGLAPEARARQTRRGRKLLDTLDQVRAALLNGAAPAQLREELRALSREGEATGDDGLDALMREIDTRAQVELAKLDRAGGA